MHSESRTSANGEVFWNYSKIREILKDIAGARHVILGFDVAEFVNGAVVIWGSSSYSLDAELRTRSWDECVDLALALSLRDVDRTRELTALKPPYDDLWFTIVDLEPSTIAKAT